MTDMGTKKKPTKKPRASSITMQARKSLLLTTIAFNGNLRLSCENAGVHRRSHYDWMKADKEYAEAFQLTLDDAIDRLEEEMWRRAVNGTTKPVYQ